MKKLIFCITIFFVVLFIGLKVNYEEDTIMSFGNNIEGDYIYYYKDNRVEDITYDIDKNIKIKKRYIQNILVKSKVIYIDLNDLDLNPNSIIKIEELIKIIRKYSKEDISIKLLKGNSILEKNINNWIFKNMDKYDILIVR